MKKYILRAKLIGIAGAVVIGSMSSVVLAAEKIGRAHV